MVQDFIINILGQELYTILLAEYPTYLSSMIFIFILLLMYMFTQMITKLVHTSRG